MSVSEECADQHVFFKKPDYGLVIYILVRTDLKMSRGKIGVQCAHATEDLLDAISEEERKEYRRRGRAKICLRITGPELDQLHNDLVRERLPHKIVFDDGCGWVANGIPTALAVGPCPKPYVNVESEHLLTANEIPTAIGLGPIERLKVLHLVGSFKLLN